MSKDQAVNVAINCEIQMVRTMVIQKYELQINISIHPKVSSSDLNQIYKVILPKDSCLAVATLADIMSVTLPPRKHFAVKL